ARKAHNDKNHSFAVTKFREFLGKFGQHKDANAARYGLALCLIDGADKNYAEARGLLQNLANSRDFEDRVPAQYYLGLAWRGLGVGRTRLGDKNPQQGGGPARASLKTFQPTQNNLSGRLQQIPQKVQGFPGKKKTTAEQGMGGSAPGRARENVVANPPPQG